MMEREGVNISSCRPSRTGPAQPGPPSITRPDPATHRLSSRLAWPTRRGATRLAASPSPSRPQWIALPMARTRLRRRDLPAHGRTQPGSPRSAADVIARTDTPVRHCGETAISPRETRVIPANHSGRGGRGYAPAIRRVRKLYGAARPGPRWLALAGHCKGALIRAEVNQP
jgi:hypothetical protein